LPALSAECQASGGKRDEAAFPHYVLPRPFGALRSSNRSASTVTVLPLTSNVSRVYPFEVALAAGESGLPKDSKVQAQHMRTIAKERIQGVAVGHLELDRMQAVEAALRLHLGL
jgi:mRNA interferase MazF